LRENADRAAEAISVEEANIEILERQESIGSPSVGLAMSPFTWSLMSGLDDGVWDANAPSYLGDSVGGNATAAGGSS